MGHREFESDRRGASSRTSENLAWVSLVPWDCLGGGLLSYQCQACECRLLAHRVISLSSGIWSLPRNSGQKEDAPPGPPLCPLVFTQAGLWTRTASQSEGVSVVKLAEAFLQEGFPDRSVRPSPWSLLSIVVWSHASACKCFNGSPNSFGMGRVVVIFKFVLTQYLFVQLGPFSDCCLEMKKGGLCAVSRRRPGVSVVVRTAARLGAGLPCDRTAKTWLSCWSKKKSHLKTAILVCS